MRHWLTMGILVMVAAPGFGTPAGADAALDSLVANERAFAAMAVSEGVRTAFLTYLAEDGVVFEPTATNGRKVWEARPATKATLLWEPSFAAVSSAGDLGYTTGPWEFRPAPDSAGTPAPPERFRYGQFNSVWRLERGGTWRVVADIGVSHAKPDRGGVGSAGYRAGPELPIRTMRSGRVNLAREDQRLSKTMRSSGAAQALAVHGTADLRLNTAGRTPAVGLEAAIARLDTLEGFLEYREQGKGVASSGDLGYTYGLAARFPPGREAPADTSVYLHVWRQEGRVWKLALAVLNPLPRR